MNAKPVKSTQPRLPVSRTKKLHNSRSEPEPHFRALYDAAPVLFWVADPDNQRTHFNKTWLAFTGRTLEQELGAGWTDALHPADRELCLSTYETAFEARQPFQMEYRLRRHDGRYRWVLDNGVPVEPSAGVFSGYIGSCVDIHDQKLAKEELELQIAERTEALERASLERSQIQTELHQARNLEAIGRLAGGVAHDFNNLMTGILGVCAELLDDPQIPKGRRPDLQEISKAAHRASALTKQLLGFGRRQMATPKVLNLNVVVSEMQSLLRRLIGADVELTFLPDSALGSTRMDPGQVEQILINLVMNSKDAMPSGGSITIETKNVELNRHDSRRHFEVKPGPYCMLAVSDSGSGMTPEVQAHAFEPFYTTKRDKGTGLGLATVYGIIKQNGGDIFLYSGAGKGTTIKVYFPRVAEAPESDRRKKSREIRGGTETVLLVEDEEIVRRVALKALSKRGYKVLEAKNAQEALEVCASYGASIHLLLTDVIMPGMNGRQLAELLASSRPELKVLYMSGYTENVILTRGILKPGISFIEKTYTGDQLCLRVREVLDMKIG